MKMYPMCSDLKKKRGINPMVLSAPWSDSYLNNCFEPPKFHHKNLYTKPLFPLIVQLYLSNKPWYQYIFKNMSLYNDDN